VGRWAAVLVLLGGVACSDPTGDRAKQVIQFREPVHYTVEKGDTLGKIATSYGVTADDLMAWNSLESDALEIGDELVVWSIPVQTLPDATQFVDARPRPSRRRLGAPRPAPRSNKGSAAVAPDIDALPDPAENDRPSSVTTSGIFGSEVDGELDDGLAEAVAGLDNSRRMGSIDSKRRTGDMRNSTTDRSGEIDRRKTYVPGGPQFPDTPVRTPRLSKPSAKRCKSQRTADVGDNGMHGGDGLSSSQIKSSIGRTLGTTRRCVPKDTRGRFTVIVELKVGCDGRVKNAYTINRGGAPASVTACIEKVLSYTAFPAHDLPDGQSFQYPINYNF